MLKPLVRKLVRGTLNFGEVKGRRDNASCRAEGDLKKEEKGLAEARVWWARPLPEGGGRLHNAFDNEEAIKESEEIRGEKEEYNSTYKKERGKKDERKRQLAVGQKEGKGSRTLTFDYGNIDRDGESLSQQKREREVSTEGRTSKRAEKTQLNQRTREYNLFFRAS